MNFCFINLWSSGGEAQLLGGARFLDKLRFVLVKKRVTKLAGKVDDLMRRTSEFDFDRIVESLPIQRDDLWDRALGYFVVKHVAAKSLPGSHFNPDRTCGTILSSYLGFIESEQRSNAEILDLKLQMMRLKCLYDLEFAAERFRRSKS